MNVVTMFVQLLPLAIGAAFSPTLLVLQLAILTGDGPVLARAWSLAVGRMLSLLFITVGGASLMAELPDFGKGWEASPYAAAILSVAGAVLLVAAGRELRRGPRPGESHDHVRFVDAPPPTLFVFGALWMFVNASTLALYLPGLHVVSRADVDTAARVAALIVLFAFASAAAVIPPLLTTIFGDRIRPRLSRATTWLERHAHVLTIVTMTVFGVVLSGFGLWNLVMS